jgi:hypothetical protein
VLECEFDTVWMVGYTHCGVGSMVWMVIHSIYSIYCVDSG